MKKMKTIPLFEDSGEKIKVIAQIMFMLEVVASIIGGIAVSIDDYNPVWLLLIPAGILIAFVTNIFLYGFGEIVDNSIHTNKASAASEGRFDSLPKL